MVCMYVCSCRGLSRGTRKHGIHTMTYASSVHSFAIILFRAIFGLLMLSLYWLAYCSRRCRCSLHV